MGKSKLETCLVQPTNERRTYRTRPFRAYSRMAKIGIRSRERMYRTSDLKVQVTLDFFFFFSSGHSSADPSDARRGLACVVLIPNGNSGSRPSLRDDSLLGGYVEEWGDIGCEGLETR